MLVKKYNGVLIVEYSLIILQNINYNYMSQIFGLYVYTQEE